MLNKNIFTILTYHNFKIDFLSTHAYSSYNFVALQNVVLQQNYVCKLRMNLIS